MVARFVQWTVDVADVEIMCQFWATALGYRVEPGDAGSARLVPPPTAEPGSPTLWLQPVDEARTVKNRAHPDLRPTDGDVDAEVDRLLGMGAHRVDVGQAENEPFVVLADPEGNEFCVLRRNPPRD